MQKKIIALAVAGLMSGAAFAQSNVTISGLIDLGYQNVKSETVANGTDRQQSWAGNGSSTSTIVFAGTEDLGGGMKAGFLLASDYTAGAQQVPGAAGANQMFNSQNYITLSGNFGDIKAGTVNNASLGVSSTSQPFGTAIGSGYSGSFGRLAGFSTAGNAAAAAVALGANTAGARLVRSSQSVVYTTPTFSGFNASLAHVFKNDNDQYQSFGQQELGLKYSGGPLNVAYAHTTMSSVNNGATVMTGEAKLKHQLLGANYKFGPATVYGGWTSSKGMTNAGADQYNQTSWNVALKYDIAGNMAVMANYLKANDKLAADQDRNLWALGFDYGMSKRTTAYARYESGDNDKSAATGVGVGKFARLALGLRHTW